MDSEWTKFGMKQDNRGTQYQMPSVFSWREAHFAFGLEEFVEKKKKRKKRKQVDYLPLTRLALKTGPDPFHLGR